MAPLECKFHKKKGFLSVLFTDISAVNDTISNGKAITIAPTFHNCGSVFRKKKRSPNGKSTLNLFAIIPITCPAIWG